MTFTEKQLKHFDAYVRVQESGRFNMITDSRRAQAAARLSSDAYWFVVENYSELQEASSPSHQEQGER